MRKPKQPAGEGDLAPMPDHIAIIMDGNGRWARRRGLPRVEGHRQGAQTVRDITEYCREMGVRVLTLYAFSEQNWDRPPDEVAALMALLEEYLEGETPTMRRNGIRLGVIGDVERLPAPTRHAIEAAMEATRAGEHMSLVLAVSYGGREEIVRAAARLAGTGTPPAQWTEQDLAGHLDTRAYSDPDILVRTGGERRLSNFLLWQLSYAELFFSATMWPEFGRAELADVIARFRQRQRRFGRTAEQLATG